MSLKIHRTTESIASKNWSFLIYGDNRTGKTHFCGTWPRPLWLVPEVGAGELRTVGRYDFPVVYFNTMQNARDQIREIFELIEAGKPIGGYVPRTLVIDNLTTAQMSWEEDLKRERDKVKLDWADWGAIKSTILTFMVNLQKLPCHVLWITHSKLQKVNEDGPPGKDRQTDIGSFTLTGDAKNVVPNQVDGILYTETVDHGLGAVKYYVNLRKKGIWPAGVRGLIGENVPVRLGPDPTYDEFAPHLGLPSLAVEEGIEDTVQEPKSQKSKTKGK